MKKYITLLFITSVCFAQKPDLYMSQPVKRAYEKETRSFDGSPGKNYWQNRSEYKIKAEVNPVDKTLEGNLSVRYFNNSPDTLKQIVMRLYPDFFRKGSNRDWPMPASSINDGVEIESLFINNKKNNLVDSGNVINRNGTNMFINLSKPLLPDESIKLFLDWKFNIPEIVTIRTGAYADTSLFVAYWYPQIAVYDDIDGWDNLTYSGTTEMYNDFSDFDVEITLPQNYLMWATGEFQNPEEVLTEKFLSSYEKAQISDSIITIIGKNDKDAEITKGDKSIWKFKADYVPDFAFGIGKNYLWEGAKIDLKSGRRVFINSAYRRDAKNFKAAARIAREAIKFHSEEMPGIEYPYPTFTAFNGSGGMEFPMIVNDEETSEYDRMIGLTTHELAHTYFPFYMGTNERRYAFMDEGMAVFLPVEIQKRLGDKVPLERRFIRQQEQQAVSTEVPPMTPSFYLFGNAYRMASYTRSAGAYFALEDLLGKEVFLEALQEFMNEWNGKHPTPYDFFFTFDRVADEDLAWFWKPWFFEFHSPDLNLVDYKNEDGNKIAIVENVGGLPMPIKLKVYFTDNTEKNIIVSPRVWKNNAKRVDVNLETSKKILEIELGGELIPDVNYDERDVVHGD